VEVSGLVADSVEAWRPFAETRNVDIRLRPTSPAFVFGDRLRLAQATGNLIANAVEHGGGEVGVRVEKSGETVRIEFVDDGPGLPAPVAELARRGRRRRGPRGHGLAVAAAVAAGHGGRISGAPSERGARVVLELPIAVRGARVAGEFSAPDASLWPGDAG
jgi:signal transduction histidine kinase